MSRYVGQQTAAGYIGVHMLYHYYESHSFVRFSAITRSSIWDNIEPSALSVFIVLHVRTNLLLQFSLWMDTGQNTRGFGGLSRRQEILLFCFSTSSILALYM